MKIPRNIIAGDSVSWRDLSGVDGLGQSVDSGAYSMKYAFRGPMPGANLDLAGVTFGNGWQFALSAAQSAAFNNGASPATWYWQAVATKTAGGAVVTLGTGTLVVKPSPAAASTNAAFDGRSQAEKDLAAVQTAITARINGDAVVEYTIGNRSLKKEPMSVLLEIEQRCKRIVARERRAQMIANGMGNPGRVSVRFSGS